MAERGVIIGFAQGDDVDVTREVTGLLAGQAISKAWLMVKHLATDLDSAAVIAKVITTTPNAGVGVITDAGLVSGIGALLFQISRADTAALAAAYGYAYGIKVALTNGQLATIEVGQLLADQALVQASS